MAPTSSSAKASRSRDGRCSRACKLGLEGVVSKVRDGPYPKGRTSDWVKKTCVQRETLTIAGFALDGTKWDGIYVGRRKGDDLVYAGKVDHGFDRTSAADLQKRLKPLIRKTQPYTKRIAHKGIWVEPKLLAEIEYRANQRTSASANHARRTSRHRRSHPSAARLNGVHTAENKSLKNTGANRFCQSSASSRRLCSLS